MFREEARIYIQAMRVKGRCIVISDTGKGIAPEDVPRIFERFYRADKAHTAAIPGTGLGLSIVKHGVSVMGAELSVESEPGRGTVMKILF